MKTFKYETHLHTSEASACGSSQGAEYISVYKKLGYDGIFVTDHFFGGNTAVSFELDWHTRVELYCKGYENALAEAKRLNAMDGGDFKVFFGILFTELFCKCIDSYSFLFPVFGYSNIPFCRAL